MESFVYRNFVIDADNLGRMYAHFIPSLRDAIYKWECKTLICPPANGRFNNSWL